MLRQVLLGAALTVAAGVFATEGVSEMAVKLFGKEEAAKRVSEGALFVDGLYVKGPYSVTREGNVILVNGRVASRFKVESKADAKAKSDARAAQEDPAADGSGAVSDEDGATVGSDPTPTLGNASAPAADNRKVSAIEERLAKKGGGSIEARLAAKAKAKDLKAQSSAGGFNREPVGNDPLALFEEADYTYTPPSRPEPKAVPYIRPAAQKSMAERMAAAKAKDAEVAARPVAKPAEEAEPEGDAIATESFDNLTDEEIAAYIQRFDRFRDLIEKSLTEDRLVLLSSANAGAKAEKRPVMRRFVASLGKLCAAPDASRLIAQWGTTLPRGYLSKIYDNRDANAREMRTLLLRVAREVKEERERAERRLR